MNVPTQNAVLFFPSRSRLTYKSLGHVEDFCRWGISLQGLAEKLDYKTASGALKFLHGISDSISADHVFEIFKPKSTDIIHADEIESKEHGKSVYRLFSRGGGDNKVAYAWGFSQVRNYWVILTIVKRTIKHNRKDPKIWVTDGLQEYHTALVGHYGKEKVRAVFLGRNPDADVKWLKSEEKENVFSISKSGQDLVISKGLPRQQEVQRVKDHRHYTTTIETILRLFNEENASCVFIQAPEKSLPFTRFSKRFLNAVKEDDFVYHFIGHCTNGNTLAEIFARQIAHRISWFNEVTQSAKSARKIFNLQMLVYNLFGYSGGPDGLSPFEEMGVEVGRHENVWKKLLPNL